MFLQVHHEDVFAANDDLCVIIQVELGFIFVIFIYFVLGTSTPKVPNHQPVKILPHTKPDSCSTCLDSSFTWSVEKKAS